VTLAPDLSNRFSTTRDVRMTDAELRARLVAGDDQALAEVYRRHGSRVIAVANAVLRDQAAAEDVCQDVFVGLSRRPEKFDSERGSLCTYLTVIAHGRALDRLRSEQARARREAQQARFAPSVSPDAGDRAVASSVSTQIWAAVSALPAKEAEAVRLAYFGDTTYRDVARILEVAEGTVKSRIRSGLRRLRAELTEQGIITAA
jgi:RNA polymerase sigma-70 factor (ECF subfamily)